MKKALLLFSLVLLSKLGFCTFYTAVANGNFESAATWSPAGGPPSAGDFFTIPAGITVTVNAAETAPLEGFAVYGQITFTSGASLQFSSPAFIKVELGGIVNAPSTGPALIFPAVTYSGPFVTNGGYFYSNTASGSVPLAVTLSSFRSETVSTGIKISWQTESEINIATYELEWSANGVDGWKSIYTCNAHNFSGSNTYAYIQTDALPGKNYYRLKTTELDHSFYFSGTIVNNQNSGAGFSVFPTIASNTVTCKIPAVQPCSIRISDLSGKMTSLANNISSYQYTFNVSMLPKGVYFISLLQNNEVSTQKIIKE
ncbi:MAG: T9SS type A sorting domain-containing protein [Bacteroidetes bacterium]|nr:T9SS type A sorting domain-containing protein [Bacteroidota bacterium]